jgi:hypothetical protein
MKSAYEYWIERFGEPPQNVGERLAVAMMAEYGREMWNQALQYLADNDVLKDKEKNLKKYRI